MDIQIFNTEDGSHSLFRKDLNEGYHSRYGAITESIHVFIEAGFKQVSNKCKEINVLEIGFGTGLNAFLTILMPLPRIFSRSYGGKTFLIKFIIH